MAAAGGGGFGGTCFEFPDDFMEKLRDTPFEDIAEKALNDTAPLLLDAVKTSMMSVISHPGDSDMVNSVRTSKPKATRTDAWIVNAYPTGYSTNSYSRERGSKVQRYPVSNGLKAVWLEYGRAGQPAKPWVNSAVNKCMAPVMDRIQKIWEEEVGANEY